MPKICNKPALLVTGLALLLLSACAGPKIAPPPKPDTMQQANQAYQAALSSMKAGKHKLAFSQFKAICKTHPTLAGPYANLGILYYQAGVYKEAEEALLQATKLNPQYKLAFNYLGMVYRQMGRFDDAERAYLTALGIDAKYRYAHLNLGILYDLYKADLRKALGHYRIYQELNSEPDKLVEKWIIDIQRRDKVSGKKGEAKG